MYTNWPVLAEFYALRVHIVFTYFYLLTEFGDSVLIVFSYRTERQRDRVLSRIQFQGGVTQNQGVPSLPSPPFPLPSPPPPLPAPPLRSRTP